jgi:hypothetical protein
MTKKKAVRQTAQENTLLKLGFTREEAEALRRISMTLTRWFEHECNGNIQRDGDDGDGKPFWHSVTLLGNTRSRWPIADRETGARKRLVRIISDRNRRVTGSGAAALEPGGVSAYIQGDPRGAALYIIRPGDVPDGKDVEAYYNRGICVY